MSTFINLIGEDRDHNALITAHHIGRTTIHISAFASIASTLARIPTHLRPEATIIANDRYDGERVEVGTTLAELVNAADEGAIILFTSEHPLGLRIPGMISTDQPYQAELTAA